MRIYLLALALTFFCIKLSAQPKDMVPNQGIISPLHKANIGKLYFTSKAISVSDLTESDFLTNYQLTPKSDLFFVAFMDNSLTNYLHALAPVMPVEDLYKNGNFQFTFYVDEKLVYTENLHHGAGTPETKNNETLLSRPLIDNQKMGRWWSQSMWNRFLANGGERALSLGKHVLKIELRTYLNTPEVKTSNLIAEGKVELTVKELEIDKTKISLNEIKPYNGWAISKENFDRERIKELKGNIEEAVFKNITSIVVIKNGKLLIEEYFNGADRNTLHDTRSVGKSFSSTMMGIAIQDGYLKSESQTLKEFYKLQQFANYSPAKDDVKLKDLLTMSSAFNGDDNDGESLGNEENMYPTDNWVKFALDLSADTAKAKKWHYFTAGVVVLGDILNSKVPGGLEKYADAKLFKPLGISNYQWQYTPQKVVNTAGGLQMNSLDLAKYGQLYKNGGKWNGKTIIPKTWVDKTFTRHRKITWGADEYYGYLFWNKQYQVNNKTYETYYCSGNGGNKVFVFKDEPLVVVITATAYNTPYAHPQVDKIMEKFILPAVMGK